jgi:hypothetical protein
MARTLRWSPLLGRLPGAEVIASAGEPARSRGGHRRWRAVGAEVAATAGELSMQRWSPPLPSHSKLATHATLLVWR